MPENYIALLILLRDHPNGLSTAQIFKELNKIDRNAIKDIKAASNLVCNVRSKGFINLHDTVTVKVHKISITGKAALEKQLGEELGNPQPQEQGSTTVAEQPIDQTMASETAADQKAAEIPPDDQPKGIDNTTEIVELISLDEFLQRFDQSVELIRNGIVLSFQTTSNRITITDKTEKLLLISQLSHIPLLEPWAIDLLQDIHADIEKMEQNSP